MTLGTILGEGCVFAIDDKTSLLGMIKGFSVEGTKVRVAPRVLDVTRDAIVGDFAVDTLLGGNALSYRFVTGETVGGVGFFARFVTFLAILDALVLGMGFGQGAGGKELSDLLGEGGAREQCQSRESQQKRPPLQAQ